MAAAAATTTTASAAAVPKAKLSGGRTAPPQHPELVFLFDVDGTLTLPRLGVQPDMIARLYALREKGWVAVVGGSDQHKILEQLGEEAITFFDYLFSENGLVAIKDGKELARRQLKQHYAEAERQAFESFCLDHIKALVLPKKCSLHVEMRSGMWNVSPIGRDCSQEERLAFEKFDHEHKIRAKMVDLLKPKFAHMNMSFAIGGQISFDAYPRGWDKTYCLQYLSHIKHVHFFGDKTYPGGNDYEIYSSLRTVGHCTTSPAHTIELIDNVFVEVAAAAAAEAEARNALSAVFSAGADAARAEDAKAAVDGVIGYLNHFFSK